MSDDDDINGWAPGQPPPWLAAYGPVPSPVDSDLAGAPGAPAPAPAPAMPEQQPGLGIPASAVDAAANAMQQPAPTPDTAHPLLPPLQPGLGIPASAVDNAANASAQQPAPTADTITGVAESAPTSEAQNPKQTLARIAGEQADANTRIATDPNALLSDRQKAWQALPADRRADIVNNSDPNALAALASAAMSPEELAQISIRHQQAQLHEQSAQQLRLAQQADEDARRNFQAHQAAVQQANDATNQLAAEAQKLSQEKIDPKEHGVGNFIASVLTGALGGAESQYTGGRNLGIEGLEKRTQQRIDAQKANLANAWQGLNFKRNLIGEQLQRSGDLYRAQEAYRVSQYDRAITELQTKMQDYDPQGTTALRGAMAVQQIQAQRAQALQAFGQQVFKNKLDAAKVDFDKQKAAQEAADKAAQRQLERENSQRSAFVSMRGQDMADARAAEEQKVKREEIAQKKASEQGDETIGTATVDANGNVTSSTLKQADGKTDWIPPKEAREPIRRMLAGADEVNRLTNQLAREIKEWGGQPAWTARGQKLNADKEALVFALHQAEKIEGFRPGTAEMLDQLTGGVDQTSWIKTATPGLLRGRDNINAVTNAFLRRSNYTGAAYAPADTSELPEPTKDGWDEIETNLKANPQRIPYEGASDLDRQFIMSFSGGNNANNPAATDRALVEANPSDLNDEQRARVDTLDPTLREAYRTGMAPSQIQNFRALESALTSSDADAKKRASAILQQLAGDDTVQPGFRSIAGRMLVEQSARDVPVDVPDLTDFPDTTAAHEVTPAAPRSR